MEMGKIYYSIRNYPFNLQILKDEIDNIFTLKLK